jgi:hypothetical protein
VKCIDESRSSNASFFFVFQTKGFTLKEYLEVAVLISTLNILLANKHVNDQSKSGRDRHFWLLLNVTFMLVVVFLLRRRTGRFLNIVKQSLLALVQPVFRRRTSCTSPALIPF